MDLRLNFDEKALQALIDEEAQKIEEKLVRIGEESVEVAKETGSYHNVTGRLRASNKYRTKGDGTYLEIFNDAPYADDVEARGAVVLSSAILFAENRLLEELV